MPAVFKIVVSFGKQNEKCIPKFELLWKAAAWNMTRMFENDIETCDIGQRMIDWKNVWTEAPVVHLQVFFVSSLGGEQVYPLKVFLTVGSLWLVIRTCCCDHEIRMLTV